MINAKLCSPNIEPLNVSSNNPIPKAVPNPMRSGKFIIQNIMTNSSHCGQSQCKNLGSGMQVRRAANKKLTKMRK